MAYTNNAAIQSVGNTIKTETNIGGNTAARVGGVIEDIGFAFDAKDANVGYYVATINGGTITATAPDYKLITGGVIRLKMPSAGTTASTLTMGNASSVPLWYNGAAVSSSNTWEANEIISVFYDGTRFMASNVQGGGGKIKIGDNQLYDFSVEDEAGFAIVGFNNGHIRTKNFDSANISNVKIENNADYDFMIADNLGNAVAILNNGHIRTKNFDSANISNVNYLKDKFNGKSIAIVGDSICTYNGWLPSDVAGFTGTAYATYYPQGDVNSVDKTWWYQMAVGLGIETTKIANTSWSGGTTCGDSTSTTYGKPAVSTKRINDIAIRGFTPDIILVSVGGNDWGQCGLSGYSTTPGDWQINDPIPAEGTITKFRNAYALLIAKIQQAYPSSRVFCCTMLDDWRRDGAQDDATDNVWPPNNQYTGDYVAFSTSKNYLIGDKVKYNNSYYEFTNNHFAGAWDAADVAAVTPKGITICEWNNYIKEIANAFGCDVIDMHKCGLTYFNIPSYAVDAGLHPNAAGHAMMARKAISELMAKY